MRYFCFCQPILSFVLFTIGVFVSKLPKNGVFLGKTVRFRSNLTANLRVTRTWQLWCVAWQIFFSAVFNEKMQIEFSVLICYNIQKSNIA